MVDPNVADPHFWQPRPVDELARLRWTCPVGVCMSLLVACNETTRHLISG